ncbi:hypothetical protein OV208_01070 [Corallococcus sp. bb12-1]|uniref:hypothetical protein n=1 Tax=Corallococcus sp. bb12-1 TaxID=2996784 RepID=UPI00226DA170|nr:hypothetical protein [Corallococcus sp. bb12-1]MCY1039891.1 hypothetical protein [Corallococcus sp. bb12-1]
MFRARAPWWLLLGVLLLLGGCRCGDDSNVGGASASFRPQETVVDFGRVLEGTQVRRSLTLVATGRAGVEVAAETESPFFVVVSQIVVPGSGTGTVDILFSAGNTPVEGELVLTAGRTTATVKLTGVGVRPLACLPEGECRESRFDLDSGQCIESPLADGASCIPGSRCQENGRCQSGACVGQPRTCNDDNPCTVDTCSPTQGCVTASVACPVPRDPCKVGVCDRNAGCTVVDVDNFTPCGAVSCKEARVCVSGTCRAVTPPDGFVCAPATPCQGEGMCSAGECMRPDAGDLVALFSAELGGEPIAEDGGPVLLVDDGTVYASVCGGDAGCRLAAYTESGLLRYESPYEDGGARTLLAASDAGVVVLAPEALEAYAPRGAGALRWRTSLALSDATPDGGVQDGVPGTGTGRVALTVEGNVLTHVTWSEAAPDAGDDAGTVREPLRSRLALLSAEAGTPLALGPEEDGGGAARLAVDDTRGAYLYTPWDGRLAFTSWETAPEDAGPALDGGAVRGGEFALYAPAPNDSLTAWPAFGPTALADGGIGALGLEVLDAGVPGGAPSLALASGQLLVGARAFLDTDGGVPVALDWDGGLRTLVPLDEPVLVTPGGSVGHAFARSCERTDGIPCAAEELRTVLRTFSFDDGHALFEVDALPSPLLPGTLHEAALMEFGTVSVLADAELPNGQRQAWLEWISAGSKVGMCALPGRVQVAGAAFAGEVLHVALQRDGVWLLESYPVGHRAETRGWPQRNASPSGTRRAVP